jgi:UDP-glucose-4-epimerase GalE
MRVLVTGGAGYIGSHVLRELVRRNHEAVVYDNLSTGHAFLCRGYELLRGDIGEPEDLAPVLSEVKAVMHMAAHACVGESVENPRKYFENNVRSGLVFLNAVARAGVRNFIFSSSCAVYGHPSKIPITEDTPREPVNPYGASKLFFEHALEAYSKAYGLRFVSLRYFNAAGADGSGEIGEWHDPETHLIPRALRVASGLDPELAVNGDDYPTPDGTCVRDYVHVCDIAEAHVLALEYLARGGESAASNLGTGRGHSVKEVLSMVESVTGCTIRKRCGPRRPGDPAILVADASRAQQLLRWKPSRSLEEIVSSAWKWLQRAQRLISRQETGYSRPSGVS